MASLPKTYKAAVLKKLGEPLVLEEVPLELPGPGEVLVKVLASGVCGTDLYVVSHGLPNLKSLPAVVGHEIVGDVVAVGSGVSDFKNGQRVGGAWHGGHDGTCRSCRRGIFQMCDHEEVNGVSRNGGFAEYVLLRSEAVVSLPADVDPAEAAPLLCAGVTVFNSLRKQHIEAGSLVAVQGLGALGHLAVQFAKAMGYDVVVLSSGDDKRDYAKQLGAIDYINVKTQNAVEALQKRGGAACILTTSPNQSTLSGLLWGLQPTGTLLVLSPAHGVELDLTPLILHGLKLAGWPSGHALDSQDCVAFARSHGVKTLIERFAFADVNKAIERVASGKARFKVVLEMK